MLEREIIDLENYPDKPLNIVKDVKTEALFLKPKSRETQEEIEYPSRHYFKKLYVSLGLGAVLIADLIAPGSRDDYKIAFLAMYAGIGATLDVMYANLAKKYLSK